MQGSLLQCSKIQVSRLIVAVLIRSMQQTIEIGILLTVISNLTFLVAIYP